MIKLVTSLMVVFLQERFLALVYNFIKSILYNIMNKKCQIFTPNNIVDLMLDEIGYCNNLSCKKFLENSCGNGNILCNVVERYITEGISQDRAKNVIKKA